MVAQQLYYRATNTTLGPGIQVATDNASPANTWTINFVQPAQRNTGGLVNGDLIGDMTAQGVEVVACKTASGCSL